MDPLIRDALIRAIVSSSPVDLKPSQAEDVLGSMEEQAKKTGCTITRITSMTYYSFVNYGCYEVKADVSYGNVTLHCIFYVNKCVIRSSEE